MGKDTFMVSICMPTYNQEDYIEQAIKGVLMQQNCDYELIIANDCSTDQSGDICKKYAIQYPTIIKLINQPYNKGIIENTKECLLTCTGKYIAICEGDDYWIDSLKLQKQVQILESDNDVSMIHTNWKNYYQEQNTTINSARKIGTNLICEKSSGQHSIEAIINDEYGIRFSTICFRKETLSKIMQYDNHLFNPAYPTLDLPLFMDLAYEGKLFFINEDTTLYRIQSESVSITKNKDKSMLFEKGCLYIKLHYLKKYKLSCKIKKNILRKHFGSLFLYSFQCKDSTLAKELKNLAKQNRYKLRLSHHLCYIGSSSVIFRKLLKQTLLRNQYKAT